MKFRLKITLALVCLLSLLFGGGSSALISLSFQNALAREQAAAKASYDQLLHTFQLVERVEVWSQPQDAVQVVQQLSAQGGQSWAALSLTAGEDVLVTQGVPAQGFLDLSGLVDPSHCAQGAFAHYDKQYLQLTGQLDIQGSPLLLNVAYDISPIYETRQQQQEAFGKIFAALLAICALLSYTAARLLTRPLDKLAQAAQALAAGDLARRSGVTSRDEIGALAREFDAMAARQQEHIAATVTLTDSGCRLTVQDTGRGMPPEALAHLTEAFYRVNKSRSRAQGGAGLGLTLCDRVAALHGGQLHLESQPGQGTTVTVTLKGGRPCPPDSPPC